jgi:CelD/BcsL family acetyltransferase involved in cellulose biosynthesis
MTAGQTVAATRVVAADPRVDPRWMTLARRPQGSLFTSPPWISAVCRTYQLAPQARVAIGPDGEPVGGLAWVPLADIRGDRLSSLPFSDRADPVLMTPSLWSALADEPLAGPRPFTLRCLSSNAPTTDPRLDVVGEAAWHGTPLDDSADLIYHRLHPAARQNIRRAVRHGVRVEICRGMDAVRRFHALHVRTRKYKYRLLAQPVALFENLWEAFAATDDVFTLLATVGDELAAGAMFLAWNDVLYYKFGASSRDHLAARPNDLTFWSAVQLGAGLGARLVDWGLSDLDQPGLVAYKRKWASVEERIVTLRSRHEPPGRRPGADLVLRRLTEVMTGDDVPDHVTARAGEMFYQLFC